MIATIQAILLGALQGITELFPISSLGHSVILPTILQWHIDQSSNTFVLFLVATHFATAVVLIGFFFQDWVLIVKGFFRSMRNGRIVAGDTYAKLAWLIIAATIPAGLIGVLLQKRLEALFASALVTALFLMCNGVVLYCAEYLKERNEQIIRGEVDERVAHISFKQSFMVGLAQCLALIPGFSRTGATLGGGLMAGLTHEEAARFSFLLATPIILAAAVLKLPGLFHASSDIIGPILIGAIAAALAAYLAVRFLTRYFKHHTLIPFARYCIIAGAIFAVLMYLHL